MECISVDNRKWSLWVSKFEIWSLTTWNNNSIYLFGCRLGINFYINILNQCFYDFFFQLDHTFFESMLQKANHLLD